jgi:hypothetical protein
MLVLLSLWKLANDVRSIDSGTAWTVFVILAGVIASMAGFIVLTWQKHGREVRRLNDLHDKKVTEMGLKINELYDKRIEDMKSALDLVQTLERVVYKERRGGKV